jgi:hypothetical protein
MRFLFIPGTCYTFFKERVFSEVNFRSTLPTPCTAALDPFPIKTDELSVA